VLFMNEVISPDSWYAKRQRRVAYRQFLSQKAEAIVNARWAAVTFTLKQGLVFESVYEKLTRDKCSSAVEEFLKRLNRHVYKRGYLKGGKKLASLSVIEHGTQGGGLHVHMLLQVPDYIAQFHEFYDLVEKDWKNLRWSHTIKEIKPCYDVAGWITYITKDISHDEECFDDCSIVRSQGPLFRDAIV
jgi:hypothetical protein